jgi:hypothetical protein
MVTSSLARPNLSLSGVYRLPPELLNEIFKHAARLELARHECDAYTLGFALSSVSRLFRQIVRTIPAFWTVIWLSGKGNDRAYRRLCACLAAMPGAMLDLRYALRPWGHGTAAYDPPDDGARFFKAIAIHCARLQHLTYHPNVQVELDVMLSNFRQVCVPALESFQISGYFPLSLGEYTDDWEDDVVTPEATVFEGGAPMLHTIHYDGIGFSRAATPTAELRSLKLIDPSYRTVDAAEDIEELLVNAPNIHTLHAIGEAWYGTFTRDIRWTPGRIHYNRIFCPSLTELKLCSDTEALIELLKTNVLTTLILYGVTTSSLVKFIYQARARGETPFPHVNILVLDHMHDPNSDESRILMDGTPSLAHLTLGGGRGAEYEWDCLLQSMAEYYMGWPTLRILETKGLDRHRLMCVLQARRGIHPIQSIRVPKDCLNLVKALSYSALLEIQQTGADLHASIERPDRPGIMGPSGTTYFDSWGIPEYRFWVSSYISSLCKR